MFEKEDRDRLLSQIESLPDRQYQTTVGWFAEHYDISTAQAKRVLDSLQATYIGNSKKVNSGTSFVINLNILEARERPKDGPFLKGSTGSKISSHLSQDSAVDIFGNHDTVEG